MDESVMMSRVAQFGVVESSLPDVLEVHPLTLAADGG